MIKLLSKCSILEPSLVYVWSYVTQEKSVDKPQNIFEVSQILFYQENLKNVIDYYHLSRSTMFYEFPLSFSVLETVSDLYHYFFKCTRNFNASQELFGNHNTFLR